MLLILLTTAILHEKVEIKWWEELKEMDYLAVRRQVCGC